MRKLIIEGILVEETQRQDNQYATLVSKLKVNHTLANQMASGNLMVSLAFAVKSAAESKKANKAAKKKVNTGTKQVFDPTAIPSKSCDALIVLVCCSCHFEDEETQSSQFCCSANLPIGTMSQRSEMARWLLSTTLTISI